MKLDDSLRFWNPRIDDSFILKFSNAWNLGLLQKAKNHPHTDND
jgi:hypothetical protein